MKLTATLPTILSAAINWQYSSMLPLLCNSLPVADEICEMAMNYIFFVWVTIIKIANTPLFSYVSFIHN